ncbi:MAG: sulfate/molybdate ABC transporter ATP-binding protein [Actinomycetota bacterium]
MAVLVSGLEARMVVARSGSFRLDFELSIGPGETAALLGPNGAGKSTAVQALAGLLPLDEGRITLEGRVLDDPDARVFVAPEEREIGVVFQDYLLFPHLSVLENIAFGPRTKKQKRDRALARAGSWLESLGLSGMASRRPGDLSGGQAQRVALGRALATEPRLLLLDEPLAALDVTTRVDLRRVLADHLDVFAGPRLLITHDPTEAFLLADQIHVIEDGRITQVGTADDIRIRPRTRYAADLAGSNLVQGIADDGVVVVNGHRLHIADHDITGPVVMTVHPTAISVHKARPEGSQRNVWPTRVDRLETMGDRVRLLTSTPLPLTVEVTAGAANALGLAEGSDIWLAIKATEIRVEGDTNVRDATLPA